MKRTNFAVWSDDAMFEFEWLTIGGRLRNGRRYEVYVIVMKQC